MDGKGIGLEKMIAYGSREAVVQNLEDAGCAPDTIECCMVCMEQGKKKELLKRLDEHRMSLLDKVHKVKHLSEKEFCLEEKHYLLPWVYDSALFLSFLCGL